MLNAEEFGITLDAEDSADESSEHESSSDDDESDYEEFRRRRKQREKKKKQDRKEKSIASTEEGAKGKQKFGGTEEEVASMIRKLNAMKLDDPDYAPVFYKVMVMDQTGTAAKCVKPPIQGSAVSEQRPRYAFNNNGSAPYKQPSSEPTPTNNPSTYPNNIPLGGGFSQPFRGCFGCHQEGHGETAELKTSLQLC
jgi:hypothetical protein